MADKIDIQYVARPKGKPDESLKGKLNKWNNGYAEFIPQGTRENQREMLKQLGDSSFYKTTGKKDSSWSVHLNCDGKSEDPVGELLEVGGRHGRIVTVESHRLGSALLFLAKHLGFGLEDRKVDGRDQRLIDPGASFLILILEFPFARIKQQHQDGQNDKTAIGPIIFHNFVQLDKK